LPAQVAAAVVEDELVDNRGTLAVIVSRSRRDEVEAAVSNSEAARAAAVPVIDPDEPPGLFGIDERGEYDTEGHHGKELRRHVVVLTVPEVKGLEFDSVIVADPGGIIAESERGLSDLYVALTRSTQRLTVVHTGELPVVLRRLQDTAA
jgi:superfamily I DNA/RNA helicase